MNSGTAGAHRPRARLWALVILGVLLAIAAAIALEDSGGGAAGRSLASSRIESESPAKFRTALIARISAQHLNYQWVTCVSSGRRFKGVPVVRCNVDFGIDPHVEAYCSVLRGGRLLTSQDDPAIPCGADDAGYSVKLTTYR